MKARVSFNKPPVSEVVCGVLFSTSKPLLAAHSGLYWSTIKNEFPRIEQVAPIEPKIENPNPIPSEPISRVQILEGVPLPRSWFLAEDGKSLIQLQDDRFLFNWKRLEESDEYPSFAKIYEKFEVYLSGFLKFLSSIDLGETRFRQYEVTYVNYIGPENGLDDPSAPDLFIDHMRNGGERFLKTPESFRWVNSYAMPDNFGRLHLTANSAIRRLDKQKVVKFEITARGIMPEKADHERKAWFELAHEWITRGFADSTSTRLHKVWERTQ